MALAPMHLPAAPDNVVADVTGAVTKPRSWRPRMSLRRTRLDIPARPDAIATPSSMAIGSLGAVHTPHR